MIYRTSKNQDKMGKVNVFIKHYYLDKAGQAPVIVEYTHNRKRWRINPDIKVNPKTIACIYDFDIEAYKLSPLSSLKPDQRAKIQVNNVLLQNMQAKFNAIVISLKSRFIKPEVEFVKQEYQREQIQVEAKSKTVAQHYAEFIKCKENEIGLGINSYRMTWRRFEKFSETLGLIFLEDLKRELLDDFRVYLKGTGLGGPSIHRHFKNLRIFLNWVKATDDEEQIHIPSAYKKLTLKVRYGDPIGLSVQQFVEFYNCDLSMWPELERTRDLVVFGVSIGGPRHGDLQKIGQSLKRHGYNVNNASITYFESKTGNAHKEIYVNKFGMEVLKKYVQFPYVPSNQRMNVNLKSIAEKLNWTEIKYIPKYDEFGKVIKVQEFQLKAIFSTKFMRKTAATIDNYLGIPIKTSMGRTGHKTFAAFSRYVDVNRESINQANAKWDHMFEFAKKESQ